MREEFFRMCDYSIHAGIKTRDAKVDDVLVVSGFRDSITRGFTAVGEPGVAVCLRPGTELAFSKDVEYAPSFGLGVLANKTVKARTARFRQVDTDNPKTHHDTLEFPDGQTVLLTRLAEGQIATVLQLPAPPKTAAEAKAQERVAHAD